MSAELKAIITQETQGERRERGGHLDGMLIVITVSGGASPSQHELPLVLT